MLHKSKNWLVNVLALFVMALGLAGVAYVVYKKDIGNDYDYLLKVRTNNPDEIKTAIQSIDMKDICISTQESPFNENSFFFHGIAALMSVSFYIGIYYFIKIFMRKVFKL